MRSSHGQDGIGLVEIHFAHELDDPAGDREADGDNIAFAEISIPYEVDSDFIPSPCHGIMYAICGHLTRCIGP